MSNIIEDLSNEELVAKYNTSHFSINQYEAEISNGGFPSKSSPLQQAIYRRIIHNSHNHFKSTFHSNDSNETLGSDEDYEYADR